jgi:hypothetical protein
VIVPAALLALWIWALVDVVRATRFRHGDRWVWLVVIVLFSLLGVVAYLVIGRDRNRSRSAHPSQPTPPPVMRTKQPIGPDDDPDFLASL